jgi:hypothetical protein
VILDGIPCREIGKVFFQKSSESMDTFHGFWGGKPLDGLKIFPGFAVFG